MKSGFRLVVAALSLNLLPLAATCWTMVIVVGDGAGA